MPQPLVSYTYLPHAGMRLIPVLPPGIYVPLIVESRTDLGKCTQQYDETDTGIQ